MTYRKILSPTSCPRRLADHHPKQVFVGFDQTPSEPVSLSLVQLLVNPQFVPMRVRVGIVAYKHRMNSSLRMPSFLKPQQQTEAQDLGTHCEVRLLLSNMPT